MNNYINLTKEEYESYLYNTKPLDSGDHGSVYFYKNGKVLKLWKDNISERTLLIYRDNVPNLVKHNYHSLLFPDKLVFCEGVLVGYTMAYFPGKNLEDMGLNIKLHLFLKAIHRLDIAIRRASNSHLILHDCNEGNIMYYEKMNIGLCVCTDCDEWSKNVYESKEKCLKDSIKQVNSTFVNAILRQKLSDDIIYFILDNGDLRFRLDAIDSGHSTELYTFFDDLIKRIEQYTNNKIITLGDVSRVLK